MLRQNRSDRGADKLYSLHAPEVDRVHQPGFSARWYRGVDFRFGLPLCFHRIVTHAPEPTLCASLGYTVLRVGQPPMEKSGSLESHFTENQQHGAELFGDIPNFTNVQPLVQISEIVA